jgi:hypothetical protein
MKTTRRNILTILGLASVSSAAIAADDVTNQKDGLFSCAYKNGRNLQTAKYDPERMATALERLAKEVRTQDVNVSGFRIESDVVTSGPDWLQQTLIIDLEVLIDPPSA